MRLINEMQSQLSRELDDVNTFLEKRAKKLMYAKFRWAGIIGTGFLVFASVFKIAVLFFTQAKNLDEIFWIVTISLLLAGLASWIVSKQGADK